MKGVEFFAGSALFSQTARERGHEMYAIDHNPAPGINLVIDIEEMTEKHVPFIPDFAWLSPPCTTYSLAAISKHRDSNSYRPKSDFAWKCDRMIMNCLKILAYWKKKNPNFIFYIENPRATLRKMPFMWELPRKTVWYCQYGDSSAKPTDIWSNNIADMFNPHGWESRPECFNNNTLCHHESAPRGSATGTQGKKDNYERSILPLQLCVEILEATERRYSNYELQSIR